MTISRDQMPGRPVCVLGLGFRAFVTAAELIALAEEALGRAGFSPGDLTAIASIDSKRDDAALQAVARHYGVPLRLFDAAALQAEAARVTAPSSSVQAATGTSSVAEAAALAAAGPQALLVVAKIKSAVATAAIARV